MRQKFEAAFPNRYRVLKSYHTIDFGPVGRIYLHKTQFNILESSLEKYIPGGTEVLALFQTKRLYPEGERYDYKVPEAHADEVIRIIKTALR